MATENFNLTDRPDRTVWRWTLDGEYSAKSTYARLHTGSIPFRGHSLIWKTWASLQVKIFLWLAFRKRHWTNDRRARHGLHAQVECYLCDQAPESIDHILTCYLYTREVWFHISSALGQHLPPAERSVIAWWRRLRAGWHGNNRKDADSLFAPVCWQIWKERNARRFREAKATVQELLLVIKAEADQWVRAGAKKPWRASVGGSSLPTRISKSY